MDQQPAPCLACGSAVPAGSTTCPDCGYAVDRHDRWRLFLGSLGTVMTLSVVFAPFGLPVLWRAFHHQQAAGGTVTRRQPPDVREHVLSVLSQHLG